MSARPRTRPAAPWTSWSQTTSFRGFPAKARSRRYPRRPRRSRNLMMPKAGAMLRCLAGVLLFAVWGNLAFAQPPAQPSDAARALVGPWELSNPDRARRCTLTFKLDTAPQGWAVTLGPTCVAAFPDLRPTAAWTMGSDDALKLVDAKGVVLFELPEVESGMEEQSR